MADQIRDVRDHHFAEIPVWIMAILMRNLKIIEQEIRVLTETKNFLDKCGLSEEAYSSAVSDLMNSPVEVHLRKFSLDDFRDRPVEVSVFELIDDLLKE